MKAFARCHHPSVLEALTHATTTVYVVETGCYENRGVSGVYASPEAAMAAHPIPTDYKYPVTPSAGNMSRPGGWTKRESTYDGVTSVSWSNGLDWDYAADITPYELIGSVSVTDAERADASGRSAAPSSSSNNLSDREMEQKK